MYAGKVVEEAPVEALFAQSAASLHAGPDPLDPAHRHAPPSKKQRLEAIAGTVPSLLDPPPGCRFAPRCKLSAMTCVHRGGAGAAQEVEAGHKVRLRPVLSEAMSEPLLRVNDLVKHFPVKGGDPVARDRPGACRR